MVPLSKARGASSSAHPRSRTLADKPTPTTPCRTRCFADRYRARRARLWTAAGAKAGGTDLLAAATMSVWSGSSLYFLDARGVEVLRDGVISTLLPGVQWIRPKASPDGGRIVYEARDAQGSPHVFVVDTASGKVIDLGGKGRAEPAFLTDRYVWYEA